MTSLNSTVDGFGDSIGCASDCWSGGCAFFHPPGRQHSFLELDHEILSTVILSLPPIQEGQLSVSSERMCTILINRLEDYACPVKVRLGKLTALDMTPMDWLGRKTSTQTSKQTTQYCHHNMASISNRSDCIILFKIHVRKWKICKKRIYLSWVCRADKKLFPRDRSLTSQGKPRETRQWPSGRIFLSTLTFIIVSYSQPSLYRASIQRQNSYNDHLTGKKPSLERWQLIRNYAKALY